jgi:signal transduction histidine kinase
MQHDIRTPLAGIVGLGDVVLSMKANEITEIHSAVKDIVNSARRLLTYCESMVDLHKIQEAVNQSEPEAISIGELIQSIYEIEKPAADTKGIKLTYQLDPKDIHCIVNKNKLERVLVNLISNAIKFTEAGSVEIHVNLVRKNNERDALLRFMINDTGIGIHEDDLDYVFQQFSKLKPSYRDTKGLNLGFGLRLAKMFVNDLGGDLSLQSEVGKGSSFLVDIPVLLPLAYLYDLVNEC